MTLDTALEARSESMEAIDKEENHRRKMVLLGIAATLILLGTVAATIVYSQVICPPHKPFYSQPGLQLAYKIVYARGNSSYVLMKYINITGSTLGSYNASYLILDVSGYFTGEPGNTRFLNTSYKYGEDLGLEEFPYKQGFLPIGAKVFEINTSKVLAMGFYDPSRNLIVYIALDYGIPVYATMGGEGENITYTLEWVRGVSACGSWQG